MDYSDKYCNMCLKAEELQHISSERTNDNSIFVSIENENFIPEYKIPGKEQFWLASEKELTEILKLEQVKQDLNNPYFLFLKEPYHLGISTIPFHYFNSFEQYLLAYFMKTNFHKHWLNNEWE